MTINELIKEAYATSVEHGWYDEPRTFGDRIALLHSELSEALEAYRDGHPINEIHYSASDGEYSPMKPDGVPVELADVMIRLLDLCGAEGIDLERALKEKMSYNKSRPHRHGGKKL